MSFLLLMMMMMALVSTTTNVNIVLADEEEAPPTDATVAPTVKVTPITPSYQYDMFRNNLPTCFDYRLKIDIGNKDCSRNLFNNIREQFETQSKQDWSQKW